MSVHRFAESACAVVLAGFIATCGVGPAAAQTQPGAPGSSATKGVTPGVAAAPQQPGVKAAPLQLVADAPARYTVKKGDTLWSIASRFLKNPWQWQQIWRMNRDQIRNPHKIYPGEVLVLGQGTDGQPQLSVDKSIAVEPERPTIRLSPEIRATPINNESIPSIPPALIDPFLTKPLIIERDGLESAAKIVGTTESRVIMAPGYKVYAVGLDETHGARWQIYRPGKALSSFAKPDGKPDLLGYEATYLGDALVDRFGEVSTLTITSATQEIVNGDRLVQIPREQIVNYPPHPPERDIAGRVISLPTSLIETGRDAVITLDVGSREGMEVGHVLALYHAPGTIDIWDQKNPYTLQPDKRTLTLPEERVGLAFVFRVFDRVSYALVLNSTKQIEVGDWVRKP